MKALIVYDSKYGNTERLARSMGEALAPLGTTQIEQVRQDLPSVGGFDLVIAGCPTWKTRPSDPMREFLRSLPRRALAGTAVAAFDTEYRRTPWLFRLSAGRAVAGKLKSRGGRLIVAAERFFVVGREGPLEDGELERATAWVRAIGGRLAGRSA